MANSIYGIGLSGLAAAQAGLTTAGHNIANVNTPGFSRQEVLMANRMPLYTGAGFLGQGVNVAAIRRTYSDFLAVQMRQTQADASHLEAYHAQLAQLDNLLGDATSGLSPALADFFASLNGVAAHPADISSRQVLISSSSVLVGRFHQIADELDGMRATANDRIAGTVTSINGFVGQIAAVNRRISDATAGGAASAVPNDLLDQRDTLILQLNELTSAHVVVQKDGSYNVFLANGQALVVGETAYKLTAVSDPADPQNLHVGLATGSTVVGFQSSDLKGGVLGGVLAYRDTVLADAQNQLGRIAVVLAQAFNEQHALGQDLAGQRGTDYFRVPAPWVQGALANTGNATLAVGVASAGALTTSDYRLQFDGTNYTVTRLSDSVQQVLGSLPQTVDGLTFGLASGAPAAGDSFVIQPTRYAARDIALTVTNPAQIAAATPIRTAATVGNVGTATISAGGIDASYFATPLAAPVTIAYASGTASLSGFPPTQPVSVTVGGATTVYPAGSPVPYQAGAAIGFGGIEFTLYGMPKDGDSFTVEPSTNGIGDNRNARFLAGLDGRNLMDSATTTLAGAYGKLTTYVGATTHAAGIENDAQARLLAQAEQAQQSVSGVNLDEEAANLQRYQQAYQAAGRVIAVANTMFETILDIARA